MVFGIVQMEQMKQFMQSVIIGIAVVCSNVKILKSVCIWKIYVMVNAECPTMDDEILCDLLNTVYPTGCTCLNYAISCTGENINFMDVKLPYVSSHTTCCNLTTGYFLAHLRHAVFINVSYNSIPQIDTALYRNRHLMSIDFSYNAIQRLYRHCFFGMDRIRYIFLKNNVVTTIEKNSFQNLSLLFVLDLSGNDIDVFHLNMLSGISIIHAFFVSQNPLSFIKDASVMTHIDLKIMFTDKHKLCCLKLKSMCFHNESTHVSCSALLPDLFLQIGTISCASCILISNLTSLILFVRRMCCKKSHPFLIVVLAVDTAHIFFGFYLLIIFAANMYYKFTFPFYQDMWKTSIICASAFTVQLFYDLFMPFLLSFLSVVRLLVVANPFDFNLNSKKFTSRILV